MPSSPPLPIRPAGDVRFLITASEAYPAMEELVRQARRRVWMSFRVFDPDTLLFSRDGAEQTWRDLLRRRLKEGIEVRILISDFDPVGAEQLHIMTWTAASGLLELQQAGDFQIMPLRHEARAGSGFRLGFWLAVLRKIEGFRKEMNQADAGTRRRRIAHWPGLWRHLRLQENGRIGWRMPRLPRIYPVSVHQKIVITDDERAVIGGLDIDERRVDDNRHDRPADQTWHDLSVEVDGRVAADIGQHMADTWNDNRLRIAAYFRELSKLRPEGATLPPEPPGRITPPMELADSIEDKGIRLLRTVSRNARRQFFRISPRTEIKEIEDAHLDLIANASDWIYLETQFFRSRTVADALARAGRRNPELQLIMILPGAPEEIAFDNSRGVGERLGEHLQAECVAATRNSFGERAAFLSPARPVRYSRSDRVGLHGAEIIYVHSKVAIADDRIAIVGSGNLNGRSLKWDTEAAVQMNLSSKVRAMKERLVRKWWQIDDDKDDPLLIPDGALWTAAATANAAAPPDERKSFLVPYDPAPAREFGFAVPGLPEELV